MNDRQDVTLGEIHRLVVRMGDEQSQFRSETRTEFRGIREHLAALNSKTAINSQGVASHEARLDGLDREMRDVKRSGEPKTAVLASVAPRNDNESLSISVTPKMWALVVALMGGLSMLAQVVVKALGWG